MSAGGGVVYADSHGSIAMKKRKSSGAMMRRPREKQSQAERARKERSELWQQILSGLAWTG